MSAAPKCTSWRGHKFEGRYSSEPAPVLGRIRLEHASDDLVRELGTKKTYECDVCVRCGFVVRNSTTHNAEHEDQR